VQGAHKMDLISLFGNVDDFVKENDSLLNKKIGDSEPQKRAYTPRKTMLTKSAVVTICIAFHQSNYRSLKAFYL
jgi:hypothetical protein